MPVSNLMHRTYKTEGVVLKRRNFGEADRIVSIFTKHYGKVDALAKGVRRITSRRAGSLEPGTQAVFLFAKGKNLDLITQSQIINSFPESRKNLNRLTQLNQILEIVDLLTRENQSHPQVYQTLVKTLRALATNGKKRHIIINNTRVILDRLGFGQPQDTSETSLKHFIENITEQKLRSKKMLDTNFFSSKI